MFGVLSLIAFVGLSANFPVTDGSARKVGCGLDPAAAKISLKAVETTIPHLLKFKRPSVLAPDGNRDHVGPKRFAPLETTVWALDVTIVDVYSREDEDVYLVCTDKSGQMVVAELPGPDECSKSAFAKQIRQVRASVEKKLKPTRMSQKIKVAARISGVGYFGRSKASDPSHNGARLMPGLSITWR